MAITIAELNGPTLYTGINREQFLALCECALGPSRIREIQTAYQFAKYAHRYQERADGRRYFDHPREVALILLRELNITDWRLIVLGLMHDIPEDSYLLTSWVVERIFGDEIARWLRLLTKIPEEGYFERMVEFGTPEVWLIKLADRLHNLRTLAALDEERRRHQLTETDAWYLPLVDRLISVLPEEARWRGDQLKEEMQSLLARHKAELGKK